MQKFIQRSTSITLLVAPWLAFAAPADNIDMLVSGVKIVHTVVGTGATPVPTDRVKVHYRGTLPSGIEFDNSYTEGEPVVFPLNKVIRCWTQGLQKMKVGGKATISCPAVTAYGAKGGGDVIPPNTDLTFVVELLGIEK
jgi:FKBP-type peptidyl-prolyl cis-trans isomerase FkpA